VELDATLRMNFCHPMVFSPVDLSDYWWNIPPLPCPCPTHWWRVRGDT